MSALVRRSAARMTRPTEPDPLVPGTARVEEVPEAGWDVVYPDGDRCNFPTEDTARWFRDWYEGKR